MEYVNEVGLFKKIFQGLWRHKDKIILKLITSTVYKNTKVRMSLSYIFSIEIDNMYLLIKGNRISQYQPIGGVFQYKDSFEEIKRSLKIRNASNDQFYTKKDLRLIVPGVHVPDVIEWFYKKNNREVDVRREFIEELVENGPLDLQDYDSSDIEFIKYEETKLRKSKQFNIKELNIYEIHKVKLTDDAKEKIKQYMQENCDFILVNAEDIEKENVQVDGLAVKIGEHAKYIL